MIEIVTKKLGQYLRTFFVLAVTAGVFYAIFTTISFSSLISVLAHSNPGYLVLAFLISLVFPLIGAKRWQVILGTTGYCLSYRDCLYVILGALPFSSITPSKSGDIIRGYYLRDRIPTAKTVGSVFTERAFDILLLVLLSLVGLIVYSKFELAIVAFIVLASITGFLAIARIDIRLPIRKSWNDKLQDLLVSTRMLTKDLGGLFAVLAYTSAIWLLSIVQTMVFFWAVGAHAPFFFMMANIPIAIFIGMIPVTLGGMGTRDSAIIYLFSDYAQFAELLGVGIMFSFFRYWLLSALGIPFMRKLMQQG